MYYVYRLYSSQEELLWVGQTACLSQRFNHHHKNRPWASEIATAKVTWLPDKQSALIAETEAIKNEKPKYNKVEGGDPAARFNPQIGSCPKCGGPKAFEKTWLCPICHTEYQRERKRKKGWTPKPPPSIVCPRCGGAKEPGPAYCHPCKIKWGYEYRKKKNLPAQDNT